MNNEEDLDVLKCRDEGYAHWVCDNFMPDDEGILDDDIADWEANEVENRGVEGYIEYLMKK